jgi:hypothetical protein
MRVKENLTDAKTVAQIQEILKPLEYTRVDSLVDIVFTASEDLQTDGDLEEVESSSSTRPKREQAKAVKYHEQCVERVAIHLATPLIKQGRCTYSDAAEKIRILCIVSKEYKRSGVIRYWYAFHPAQKEFLDESNESYIAFGCGSADQIILIPARTFNAQLPRMRTTESDNRFYWHVEIFKKNERFLLNTPTDEGLDITSYLISKPNKATLPMTSVAANH